MAAASRLSKPGKLAQSPVRMNPCFAMSATCSRETRCVIKSDIRSSRKNLTEPVPDKPAASFCIIRQLHAPRRWSVPLRPPHRSSHPSATTATSHTQGSRLRPDRTFQAHPFGQHVELAALRLEEAHQVLVAKNIPNLIHIAIEGIPKIPCEGICFLHNIVACDPLSSNLAIPAPRRRRNTCAQQNTRCASHISFHCATNLL